ncbi:hypothetical protein ACHAXS_008049 [Conticribra weissflogii]
MVDQPFETITTAKTHTAPTTPVTAAKPPKPHRPNSSTSTATTAATTASTTSFATTPLPATTASASLSTPHPPDEDSDEASDVAVGALHRDDDVHYDDPLFLSSSPHDEDHVADINAAPMHLHALRTPARLRGTNDGLGAVGCSSGGSVAGSKGGGRRSRSTSRSRPRSVGGRSANSSRSSSPNTVLSHETGSRGNRFSAQPPFQPGNNLHTDASVSSAQSSLDGMFDPDIFLDRLGFVDLDPPLPHEIRLGPLAAPDGKTSSGLTPVNERLSEETLEDCHAFQDLYCPRTGSRGGLGAEPESGNFSSNVSMPSMAHSSLSGVGSVGSVGSVGMGSVDGSGNAVSGSGGGSTSLKGRQSREGSITGASVLEGDASVILETLDEVEDEEELGLDD